MVSAPLRLGFWQFGQFNWRMSLDRLMQIKGFRRNPTGEISADDRAYLNKVVMRQGGGAEPEATARVDKVISDYRAAVAKLQQTAEKARKFTLLLAFAVASTLVLGFLAAWWAAVQGGEHRDQSFDFRPHIAWTKLQLTRLPSPSPGDM